MKFLTPLEVYGDLFIEMNKQHIVKDQKILADAKPKYPSHEIVLKYTNHKDDEHFDLKQFFYDNFEVDEDKTASFHSNKKNSTQEHIERLWPYLERPGESENKLEGYSLIPLHHDYIVPGGRFNEIYYWDSYFTMLGLSVTGKIDRIRGMVQNFAQLIDEVGHIPNGNRTYFISRSQPPFFSLMVELLAGFDGEETYVQFLPQLVKEYEFWMTGKNELNSNGVKNHVVRLEDSFLNRYFDNDPTPRQEMYQHDVDLLKKTNRNAEDLYGNIRAACESGWDFSSRWLLEANDLYSIHANEILPVDLNCLLYHLEKTISSAYIINEQFERAKQFQVQADKRARLIQDYFWRNEQSFYFDYDFGNHQNKIVYSLAGYFPLLFNLASKQQAEATVSILKDYFLKPGGLVSTPYDTGQQWDSPNGWAPLQWITVKGLLNYGYNDLAKECAQRWLALNDSVFHRTGKMMEKYNVCDLSLLAGGGEYESQTGFGWTNGVYLKLKDIFA